jgi:hypothetical protein
MASGRWLLARLAAMRPVRGRKMTRRDDVGELLEGYGTEDTMLDGDGDNTGDAGDRYRGSLRFGTTAAEESRGQSLDQLLAEEEPDAVHNEEGEPEWNDRGVQRELTQLVSGGNGLHSRTDPDLVGRDRGDMGLSAEEAALHVIQLWPTPTTAD